MTTTRHILPYLRHHVRLILIGILAILIGTGFGALQPYILRLVVDSLHYHPQSTNLLWYVLVFLASALGQAVSAFVQRSTISRVSRFVEYELRNDLFSHLQELDQRYFHEMHTGDLMARLTNDLSAVRQFIGMGLISLISTAGILVVTATLMLIIDWRLALVTFAVVPAVSVCMVIVGRSVQRRFRLVQDQFGQLSTEAQENFSGIRVMKAFVQEQSEIEAFSEANEEYVRRNLSYVRLSTIMWPLMFFVMGIALALVLFLGGMEVIHRQITLGQFVQFNSYLAQLTWPMISLGWIINLYQQGAASMARIMEVLNRKPWIRDSGVTLPVQTIAGRIEFVDVGVRYGEQWVLRHVSFTVPQGATVAIVGPTGAGKSTLMSLVTRVLDPDEGCVLVDGVDIRRIPLATLRGAVGYVPQDTFLFSASLRDNALFGVSEPDGARLAEAIAISRLDKDLEQFTGGLDTVVGERGVSLSGGQKQRTSLARAIMRDPTILILDDALSSVDTHTQSEILGALSDIMRRRTTLLTAMRISTVKDADFIVVLADGGVQEQATHQELAFASGLYSSMYRRELLQQELETE